MIKMQPSPPAIDGIEFGQLGSRFSAWKFSHGCVMDYGEFIRPADMPTAEPVQIDRQWYWRPTP